MAKIKPMVLLESMSGKACSHSDVSFRTNKITGAVYSMKLCNPYDGGNSAEQIAVRNLFKTVAQTASAICKATSSDQVQTNYTKQVAYRAAFKNQNKCGNFYNFVWKKEYELAIADND